MTEPYKFVCTHVLLDGAQPVVDLDGDALCFHCRKAGWVKSAREIVLAPIEVYNSVVLRWGVAVRLGA